MKTKKKEKSSKALFLEKILKGMAVLVLKKYKPKIIGITGSVGKTSASEAVRAVLSCQFRVRKNIKNYNNEIGLPLTIIGSESGGKSFFKWLGVFLKWLGAIVLPLKYPEVLVLEMGVDRPGDMKYFTDFIQPDVAILTDISSTHLEYFKSAGAIIQEKATLIKNIKEGGTAILNIDNPQIAKIKDQLAGNRKDLTVLTFGFDDKADVSAADVSYNYSENSSSQKLKGLSFKLNYKGTTMPMRMGNALARHNVYAALAGAAAGVVFKINLVEVGAALENFSLPRGRMNLIAGIKNSFIIDDTYNASLVSSQAALEVLGQIKASRKIAVLGDMLELGVNTESDHRKVAKKFMEIKGNIFFAVGKRMESAVDELKKHNFSSENILTFSSPMEAGRKLQEIMREGDLVLIKGSQGMRMEKVAEEVMAQPQKASKLLCRQDRQWREKEWREV